MAKRVQEQGPITDSDLVPVLAIEARKRLLPSIITRIILGARAITPWHSREDVAVLEDVYGATKLSIQDFMLAQSVAEKIVKELGLQRVVPAHQILAVRDRAQDIMESMEDERAGKCGIIMLKDQGGCGHWRMVLPARHMDRTGIYIDVTGGAVDFDHLLEYDTIFVQRVHNWDSVEVLRRLKGGGKRIIYDIDDDIFAIPEDNPASKAFGRSEQMAAVECMKLSDVVTVSTSVLQDRLAQMLNRSPVVVPNAIDPDDNWVPTPMTGSPDEWKRIFWQGSNTHDEDWGECFEAVDQIMRERKDVRLVVLGFLPSLVRAKVDEPHWAGRVEFMGPMPPEAYFRLIKHIRGEVGLAPLRHNWFNWAKSNIKWIENAMTGFPTVASDVQPYCDTIREGEDGFLCSSTEEWFDAIKTCLDDERTRRGMVENARRRIRAEFNIKTVSNTWRNLLLGTEAGPGPDLRDRQQPDDKPPGDDSVHAGEEG